MKEVESAYSNIVGCIRACRSTQIFNEGELPLMRFGNHIALVTSISEPSSCFKGVRCNALMEENDFCTSSFMRGNDYS